jgi:hypothetical protein
MKFPGKLAKIRNRPASSTQVAYAHNLLSLMENPMGLKQLSFYLNYSSLLYTEISISYKRL